MFADKPFLGTNFALLAVLSRVSLLSAVISVAEILSLHFRSCRHASWIEQSQVGSSAPYRSVAGF